MTNNINLNEYDRAKVAPYYISRVSTHFANSDHKDIILIYNYAEHYLYITDIRILKALDQEDIPYNLEKVPNSAHFVNKGD